MKGLTLNLNAALWRCAMILAVVTCTTVVHAQPPCPAGTVLAAAVAAPGGMITIAPNGLGETFAAAGTPITVCITCSGVPLVGLPAAAVTVTSPALVICPVPGANIADAPTDAFGCTTFTGTILGGGCAPSLDVVAAGALLGTVPIMVKSVDAGFATPGFVDVGDLAALAARLGRVPVDACFDYTDSGVVDAGDLAFLAGFLGTKCP